jgi:prevent-host-death family protein
MVVKDKSEKWQLQTAKSRFSTVVERAMSGRPQLVTKNGKPAVYVISVENYEKLKDRKSLKETLLSSPHRNLKLPIDRQKDFGRTLEL